MRGPKPWVKPAQAFWHAARCRSSALNLRSPEAGGGLHVRVRFGHGRPRDRRERMVAVGALQGYPGRSPRQAAVQFSTLRPGILSNSRMAADLSVDSGRACVEGKDPKEVSASGCK